MKKINFIIMISAIMMLSLAPLLQEATAQTVVGSVTVDGNCELVITGNLVFGNLNPLSNPTSDEATVNLANSGNFQSITSVAGTQWQDTTGSPADQMNVGQTVFDVTSQITNPPDGSNAEADDVTDYGNYGSSLALAPGGITNVQPASNDDTFWRVQILLLNSAFSGDIEQDVTFSFNCVTT